VDIEGNGVDVSHKIILSMTDGNVCNALKGTTSIRTCNLCGSTRKQFNRIKSC